MAKTAPGPADVYGLPPLVGYVNHDIRKQRLPQYSFGTRTNLASANVGPGPARYNIEKLVRYGITKANYFTLASRVYLTDKNKVPGPQTYAVHKAPIYKGSNAPSFSFGTLNTFTYKTFAPGPNRYGINDSFTKNRAPAYSIGVKKYLSAQPLSPGPARYAGGNLNTIKPESPKYSMTPRTQFTYKLSGPAANQYNRTEYKPGKRAPTYSFGIRHSLRSGTMIVPCDNI